MEDINMPIPTDYKGTVQQSAKERAFDQIQEWIIDGTLLPGEKLNDFELARAINVSRTPIREALQLLSQQGFVTMKPGVATYVNEIDAKDVVKILPPLSALQALAAELATENVSKEDIQKLQIINKEFQHAIETEDFYGALKQDEQFHKIIVDVCDNEYISNVVSMFQAHVRRLFFQKSIILSTNSVNEHEELIAALEEKDSEKAAIIAKKNWLRPVQEKYQNKSEC
jgi:DNA-binding GntR family transcriptional regulator